MERSLVLVTPSIVTQGERVFGTMFWMTVVSDFAICDVLSYTLLSSAERSLNENNTIPWLGRVDN